MGLNTDISVMIIVRCRDCLFNEKSIESDLASNTKRTHLAEEAADQVAGEDPAAEGDVDLSFL